MSLLRVAWWKRWGRQLVRPVLVVAENLSAVVVALVGFFVGLGLVLLLPLLGLAVAVNLAAEEEGVPTYVSWLMIIGLGGFALLSIARIYLRSCKQEAEELIKKYENPGGA